MSGRPLSEVPAGWQAVPLRSFKSFEGIRDALGTSALSPDVKGILYDYENWRFTPAEEQQNPAKYLKQAADLVHAQGLLFLTAPAVDLVPVLAPDSDRKRQDETYLRLGLAADGARYADVFDVQSQRFERDTGRYARFVREAATQARQANPKVMVLQASAPSRAARLSRLTTFCAPSMQLANLLTATGSIFPSRQSTLPRSPNFVPILRSKSSGSFPDGEGTAGGEVQAGARSD